MAQLLSRRETDPEKKEMLLDIAMCAKELLDYCNSILDFSRIENGHLPVLVKSFNLLDLVERIIRIEKAPAVAKNLELSLQYDNQLPVVIQSDGYRIERMMINLISNAIKFTQQGYVKFAVKLIRLDSTRRGAIIQFSVEDSGIGVPSDKKELIYERFTKVAPSNQGIYKGQGLGLRIVKQFIEELDGDIHLETKIGEGSTFTVLLPVKLPLSDELLDS